MLLPKKGYADERFLKTHQGFYLYAKKKLGWTSPDPVWNEIPSEDVERFYNEYQDMQKRKVGQVRLDEYRENHSDLDDWLFLTGKVSVRIIDKKRREGMTPREKAEEVIAAGQSEIDKRIAELRKRLAKLG